MTEPVNRTTPVTDPVDRTPTVVTHRETDEVKNLVQWGPIIAGVATTVAVMVVLTVLGLAIGASALEPGDSVGTAAGIWGAASAIVAFFLGGMVAASSASVPEKASALLNGFLVGATVLAFVLYLTGSGLGNLFGTVGNNLGDIANVVEEQAEEQDISADEVESEAQDVADDITSNADAAFDAVADGAWGTLGGILLALGAATAGGLVGSNSRRDLADRSAT